MGVRQRSKRLKKRRTIDIPDWLLFELLLRLPLNRVFACRLVSKQWLSIASDPYFIRAYASRASSVPQPYWTIPPRYGPGRPIFAHKPRDLSGYIGVAGVSDGMALHYSYKHTPPSSFRFYNFYLSNPITGQWTKACELNGPPPSYARQRWGFLTRVDREFVLRSYRIVRARPVPDAVAFDVYNSETNAWKALTAALPGGTGRLEMQAGSGAALDGILHWAEMNLGVIVFDPEAIQMRVIPRPRDVAGGLRLCQCVEYRGELRYIGVYSGRDCEFPGFSIWRRTRLGEWCIQHEIESKDMIGVASFPITVEGLFLDPRDPDVVYYVASGQFGRRYVLSYSLTSRRLNNGPEMIGNKVNRIFGFHCETTLASTLSLVAPPWPTRVAEELLGRR